MIYDIIKQNFSAYLGIVFTMIAIPYTMFNSGLIAVTCGMCLLYTIWMRTTQRKGYTLIIIAMALTLPSIVREIHFLIVGLRWVPLFLEGIILILSVIDLYQKKNNPIKGGTIVCLIFIILSVLYSSGLSARYVRNIFDAVIFFHLVFYICYNDKLSFEEAYRGLSLIFFITAVFAILHYFFNKGPYMVFLDTSWGEALGYVYIKRASGLLGNSLVLCSICSLYHAIILLRFLKTHKINILFEVLCIATGLITISRTVLVVFVIQFMLLLLFNKAIKIKKLAFGFLVLIIIINVVEVNFGILEIFSNRIESTINDHRESGYSTTWEIVSNHPFGVGKQKVSKYIHEYNTGGISEELVTLDNCYLTQIASYGFFSFFIFPFYLFYFYKCPRNFRNKKNKQALFLLVITWCLIGLSFDLESFNAITAFCFGSLAFFYRILYEQEILCMGKLTEG